MFNVLVEPTFFLSLGITVIVCAALTSLATLPYNVSEGEKKSVAIDRLSAASNAVTTVSGFTVPLISGLAAWAYLQGLQPEQVGYLVAALVTTMLSLISGLFAVTSMAAKSTTTNGTIDIHKSQHRNIPTLLFFQLAAFIGSTVLVSLYVVFGISPGATPDKGKVQTGPAILRSALLVDLPADEVISRWGAPESTTVAGSAKVQTYVTERSVFEIRTEGGKIVQVIEKSRRN